MGTVAARLAPGGGGGGGGHYQYILVGVCRSTSKNGGSNARAQPKKGGS